MAYRDVYRSPSQSSSTSISAIDGIEIRISDKLVPPPPVILPVEYETGNPSEILFMEYDFSVEEHVLQWTEAQRQNEQAIQQAATERVGETIEIFAQAAEPQTAAPDTTVPQSESAWNGQEQNTGPAPSPFMNLGSTILTPMPINSGHSRKESGSNKAQTGFIDLKDFENVQDPFENMELKVLNDREELNKMVFAVQPLPPTESNGLTPSDSSNLLPVNPSLTAKSQDPSRPSPPATPINLKDVDYPDVESLDSGQFSTQQPPGVDSQMPANQGSVQLQTNSHQAYYQSPQAAAGAGLQYPSQSANRDSTFPFTQGMPLPPIPTSHYLVQQPLNTTTPSTTSSAGPTPYMSTNSASGSAVSHTSQGLIGQAGASEAVSLTSAGASYARQLGDKGYVPYQNYYSRHSVTNTATTNGHLVPNQDSRGQQAWGGQGGRETPPLNPLRSVRSTPDISGSEDRRLPPLMPSSHTPPPTARSRSPNDLYTSGSPPARPSTEQEENDMEDTNWNHYNILPSTPRSSVNTPPSPKTLAKAKAKLPNPYESLTHEAQRFVENITDMGFPRARVARAVKKLGNDDKQVVDHLCMVNRLSDKGYDSDDSETALNLFENNIEKAEQYLKLLSQFKEIGFVEKNIQEALVSTNLDENKTLDLLTAS